MAAIDSKSQQQTAWSSVAAEDANVISAVITRVKKNNNLTFLDDTGLRPEFEKWSNYSVGKVRLKPSFNRIKGNKAFLMS